MRSACPAGGARSGIITATSDDALYAALDQGTKASPAEVVYAKSFYAGAGYPSGPLSGECIGVYAARDPAEVDAALDACLAYLEDEAWFYAAVTAEEPDRPVAFFPHVIASVGRYLAPLADIPVGSPLAYLIAPPLESVVGLDAACKAGRVADRQVVRPAVGDQLRRRLPGRRSARLRGGRARVRRRDRRRLRGAAWRAGPARGAGESMARPPARAADGGAAPGRFQALATGERFAEKPDHLTHLVDDASLVPKTHPRIAARGKLDLLQSALLDAQVAADADGARGLVGELGEILELARALVGAEVTGREVPPPTSVRHGLRRDPRRDPPHPRALRRAVHVSRRAPGAGGGEAVAGARHRARGGAGDAGGVSARARRGDGAAGARRPGPRAEPDLVGALPLACRYVAGLYRAAAGRSGRCAAGNRR